MRQASRSSTHALAPARAAVVAGAALLGLVVLALPSRGEAQSSPASSTIQATAQILDPSWVAGSWFTSVGTSTHDTVAGLSVVGAGYRVQVRSGAEAAPIVLLRGSGSSTFAWSSLAAGLHRADPSTDSGASSPKVLEVVLEVLD